MHVVDVTMFYGGGGGGVTTYLNAKARWLAAHTRVRHTIASPNLALASDQLARAGPPYTAAIRSLGVPGLQGYRWPRSAQAAASVLLRLQPALIEAGDAGPCAWGALQVRRQLGIPLVGFYHSDFPLLVGRRFGAAAGRAARHYVWRLYRHCDLLLAPSAAMVRRLAAMGLDASRRPAAGGALPFAADRRPRPAAQRTGVGAAVPVQPARAGAPAGQLRRAGACR